MNEPHLIVEGLQFVGGSPESKASFRYSSGSGSSPSASFMLLEAWGEACGYLSFNFSRHVESALP